MRILKYTVLVLLGIILYVVTAVPVGLFIYSVKSKHDIDIFSKTGFHAYMTCVAREFEKADRPNFKPKGAQNGSVASDE